MTTPNPKPEIDLEEKVRQKNLETVKAFIGTFQSREAKKLALDALSENPVCGGCGHPHLFDTSIPSPLWNEIIRGQDCSDYLCAICLIRIFAQAGRMFVAQLWGDDGIAQSVLEFRPIGVESSHRDCFAQENRLLGQLGDERRKTEVLEAELTRQRDRIKSAEEELKRLREENAELRKWVELYRDHAIEKWDV